MRTAYERVLGAVLLSDVRSFTKTKIPVELKETVASALGKDSDEVEVVVEEGVGLNVALRLVLIICLAEAVHACDELVERELLDDTEVETCCVGELPMLNVRV